jgi:tetratricopeptide (TPR) repeat protein
LEILLRDHPKSVDGRIQVSRVLMDLKREEEALKTLEAVRTLAPKDPRAPFMLGLFKARRKKFRPAIPHYRRAIALAPKNERYLFNLGVAHYELKEYREVARVMQAVLKINPRNSNANNLLGYMWSEQGIRLDEAVAAVEKALALEPNNGAFMDSLGWVYYKKGWLKKALKKLELATSLLPDDPVILDHLGDVYFALKRWKAARRAWRRSLKIDSKNKKVRAKFERVQKELQRAERR